MTDTYFVVSRYNEDFQWVKEYTENYYVYNKGEPILGEYHVKNVLNKGMNQRDIFDFIWTQYLHLPECIAFVQAYPFDHCKKEIFDRIIHNKYFTPIEYYGNTPANNWERRTIDGGFMEINNSWYISSQGDISVPCKYKSYDEFMNSYFNDYVHTDWIRFAPGSQYIVTKHQLLRYSSHFWYKLMNELNAKNPTEGHIIERALWTIFQGVFHER